MTEAHAPTMTGVMTLDEFIRRYDTEGPFEIIDGEIVKLSPNVLRHNRIGRRILKLFEPLEEQGSGEAFYESPFVLTYTTDWVAGSRVPDVMFVLAERLEAYREIDPQWEDKPLVMPPDLAVEVVSPGNTYTDITQKVTRYLGDGVKMVLVIDPKPRKVAVHKPNSTVQTLNETDEINFGDLLPDFKILVARIFEI